MHYVKELNNRKFGQLFLDIECQERDMCYRHIGSQCTCYNLSTYLSNNGEWNMYHGNDSQTT